MKKIKLFDSLVSSVLNYASEVWGYDNCKDIEIVHEKFCRYLLGVKKSTNIAAMYGELGRMPLRVVRNLRMLKYWIRILENNNENPFAYRIYEMMYNDIMQGRYRVIDNWAFQIKKILDEYGYCDVWLNQKHIVPNFILRKQRITDQYKQEWLTIVHFKRLGSRVSHDSFNQYVFFFSKQCTYCKTNAIYTFFRFLERRFLNLFQEYRNVNGTL